MILKYFCGLLAALVFFAWLGLCISPLQTKSEIKNDTSNYKLVNRVRKKAAGRTLNEFYCVYISEEGKTQAIKVTEKECEEEI